ncbi:MAG TPA: hypothetical protein VK983_03110 [Candidatus Limnocylindrales bacterium]|nr:hypothetical protein [Candidatus Limnocylindrales bacterium]
MPEHNLIAGPERINPGLSVGLQIEHGDGVVRRAENREIALKSCPFLIELASMDPEAADAFLDVGALGNRIIAAKEAAEENQVASSKESEPKDAFWRNAFQSSSKDAADEKTSVVSEAAIPSEPAVAREPAFTLPSKPQLAELSVACMAKMADDIHETNAVEVEAANNRLETLNQQAMQETLGLPLKEAEIAVQTMLMPEYNHRRYVAEAERAKASEICDNDLPVDQPPLQYSPLTEAEAQYDAKLQASETELSEKVVEVDDAISGDDPLIERAVAGGQGEETSDDFEAGETMRVIQDEHDVAIGAEHLLTVDRDMHHDEIGVEKVYSTETLDVYRQLTALINREGDDVDETSLLEQELMPAAVSLDPNDWLEEDCQDTVDASYQYDSHDQVAYVERHAAPGSLQETFSRLENYLVEEMLKSEQPLEQEPEGVLLALHELQLALQVETPEGRDMPEQPITLEVTEKLLRLLETLGYDTPAPVLVDYATKHGTRELMHTVARLSAAYADDLRHEAKCDQPVLSVLDDEAARMRLGRLLFAVTQRLSLKLNYRPVTTS